MHSVRKSLGKFIKSSEDENRISIILQDFDHVDKLLAKIIDSTKAWRDSWQIFLRNQSQLVGEFEGIYAPINSAPRNDSTTLETALVRTHKLREECEDLQSDLLHELDTVDQLIIKPAARAKDDLTPMKRIIKKRADRKLDYDRYQDRVDNYYKKKTLSNRDNEALAKAESDLAKAKAEYKATDENLRQHLPLLISAIFSLLPIFLAVQIEIQNSILGNLYTMMHDFCEQEKLPSPAPPMEEVIEIWSRSFSPVQKEVESFRCLINGKAVQQPLSSSSPQSAQNSTSRPVSRSSYYDPCRHRPSTSSDRSVLSDTRSRPSDLPSPARSMNLTIPNFNTLCRPSTASSSTTDSSFVPLPEYFQTPGSLSQSSSNIDYFSRRQSTAASSPSVSSVLLSPDYKAAAIAKKKPPPPPPPKPKFEKGNKTMFVTALYDFEGQGAGDLAFREGDRIQVLQKTDSTDGWWEGELRGVRGSFPANYVSV
ncbi:hypothetical protein MPDQ_004709 [Monascus purpureus]|uniref:SH3 domain-containing protein n=1 Tax=Monascus purpureus TaxID=5098 RepID=A0A507QH02_MONPU|nr:hypothetical protein MPDQ_004709 [Monascus purpureus]BDD58639.1 hypothetical protein MAP00_003902 [Monascus purpureus]